MEDKSLLCDSLDGLSILENKRGGFKRTFLQFLEQVNKYGGDLTLASPREREEMVDEYLKTDSLYKYQLPKYSTDSTPDVSDSPTEHFWLVQVADILINERQRQQSQGDPSYTETPEPMGAFVAVNTPKKRKRPSEQALRSKPHAEKTPKKPLQSPSKSKTNRVSTQSGKSKADIQPPRSATIESGSQPLRDIPYRSPIDINSDSDDSLPSIREVMQDRSGKKRQVVDISGEQQLEPSTPIGKGKAPVRNPPSPLLQFARSVPAPKPMAVKSAAPTNDAGPTRLENNMQVDADTLSAPSTPTPTQRQHRQGMTTIEAGESSNEINSRQDSPMFPTIHDVDQQLAPISVTIPTTIKQHQPIISESTDLPTPPPTVRRPHFTDSFVENTAAPTGDATNADESVQMEPVTQYPYLAMRRCMDLRDDIRVYMAECETLSNEIARDPRSSEREKLHHGIRAAAFAHMKLDIGSRLDAWLGNKNVVVTNYCLHHP